MSATETTDTTECFVIGPIGDRDATGGSPERDTYEQSIQILEGVIEPACLANGLTVVRADRIARTGETQEQVCLALRDMSVVIADLTGANPNVMYELGLRHTTGLLTIQIGEKGRLPFDVANTRTIMFLRTAGGLIQARKDLQEALASGLRGDGDRVTATRVFAAVRTAAEAPSPSLSDPAGLSEPAGFLEVLVEMEAAAPLLPAITQELTDNTQEMADIMRAGTAEAAPAQTASARLAIANRVAERLSGPATRISNAVGRFEVTLNQIAPGMSFILDRAEQNMESRNEANDLMIQIAAYGDVMTRSVELLSGFRAALSQTGEISRSLRRTTAEISRSLSDLIDLATVIISWGDRARRIQAMEP